MLHAIEFLTRLGVATVLVLGPAQSANGELSLGYVCTSPTVDTVSGGSFAIEVQQNSVAGSVAMSSGSLELIPGCIFALAQPRPDDLFTDSFE